MGLDGIHLLHRAGGPSRLIDRKGPVSKRYSFAVVSPVAGWSNCQRRMKIEVRRVLVPTDFSDTSNVALRWAVALVEACRGSLHVLHVLETIAGAEPLTLEIDKRAPLERAIEVKAWEELNKLFSEQEQTRLRVELAVEWGLPVEEILRYAKAHDVDLIAMGAHGRRGVGDVLLGTVAEGVVRDAPASVLTVRAAPTS